MDYSITMEQLSLTGQGDHMVLLYDDDSIYNAEIIAAYVGSRILKHEKCFYISGDIDNDLIIERLERIINYDQAIESGQLSILSKKDAYSKDGYFNPDNMIKLLKRLSLEAVHEGYEAFAITGEISWVLKYEDGFERIMEYEYKLNKEIFGEYPVSAVCRYNLNKFSSVMIKNIIEVHPIIIWQGQVHNNPFYFEVADINTVDMDSYQVTAMLDAITRFSDTKSKFTKELNEKEQRNQKLQMELMEDIIISLTSLLEIHDEYTKNHSVNVAVLSKKIAEKMNLSKDEVNEIYFAGLVHDIGKTIIPSEVINKKDSLTDIEYEMVKMHSTHGYEALIQVKELKNLAELVLSHHERIDGKGYPNGKVGEQIPLGSRILCVADAYDAMTNDRPYKKARNMKLAINELIKCSGTQFDSIVVNTLVEMMHI